MHGRRYNEGLHQAIEAKEHVAVQQESMTLATISFQNYFRLYDKLSGMTGTAFTEAEEFQQIYGLDVIQIPSNKPMIREDRPDKIFKNEEGKIKALVADVKEFQKQGRPVLIGSASIAKNERISAALKKAGIAHEVLNAKNNEHEASIVAKAGEKGAVTLATNIAGRGTDIVLAKGVKELGGLVVLGSERHEARRIDNQLRGRGGRQGDPGVTQFYVSAEDDLMRIFQGDRIAKLMDRLGVEDDMPIENRAVSKTLEAAQKRVEGYNYDSRKNVVQYDNVINRHRKVVYKIRRQILEGENITGEINKLIDERVKELTLLPSKNNRNFVSDFTTVFPVDEEKITAIAKEKKDNIRYQKARALVTALYKEREQELGEELIRGVEREVYMQVVDVLWMNHLENMQHLRDGIHWRSVGQRDPLVEYRSESQKLFDSLQATLRQEVLNTIFHVKRQDVNQSAMTDDRYESELIEAAAKSVVAQASGGKSLAEVANGLGLSVTSTNNVTKSNLAGSASSAVADAVFAAPQGSIAKPARGKLGWAVVRVDKINQVAAKSIEQARTEIEAELTKTRSEEMLTEMTSEVEDAFADGSTIADMAKQNGLKIETSPKLLANGRDISNPAYKPIPEMQVILPAAFQLETNGEAQLIEIVPGERFAMIAIADFEEAAPPPLATVRAIVQQQWALAEGAKGARAVAERIRKAVDS
ncbi:hypothetical protein B7Z17_01355, partial [Candidatus Saccharibacteria bacterium 32-49-10]